MIALLFLQDQYHLLQDSSPLGMVGFYGESSSATNREFFLGKNNPSSFQAVIEASSKANYNAMEEDGGQIGQKQDDSMSSLQLRSPVPGDTASPSSCSHHNGASLPPGGNSDKVLQCRDYIFVTIFCCFDSSYLLTGA